MSIALVISPLSMKELFKFSPKKYPKLFDEYGNLDLDEYYVTPEGQQFLSIKPLRFNNLRIKNKQSVMTHIFWDLCYLNLYYNGDCYISVASSSWFEENWGHWGHCNFMSFAELPRIKNFKPWIPWGEEDKFNELLKEFEKKIDLRKKIYYEFKIEGVKE